MDLLERAKILLKATKELLEKQEDSCYVLNLLAETVFYDGVDCDGNCLKDDIGYWFDELEDASQAKTIPLDKIKKAREEIKGISEEVPYRNQAFNYGIRICETDKVLEILDKLISEREEKA